MCAHVFFTVLVTVSKDGAQASACIELLPALLLQFEGSIFFFFFLVLRSVVGPTLFHRVLLERLGTRLYMQSIL